MAITIGRTTYTFDDEVSAPKPAAKVKPFVDEPVKTAESKPKAFWRPPPKPPAATVVWCCICTVRKAINGDDVCTRRVCQQTRVRQALASEPQE